MKNKFAVVRTEHTESFCDEPSVLRTFTDKREAVAFIKECVEKSLREFPQEERTDWNIVRSGDGRRGFYDYGCAWTILDLSEKEPGDEDWTNKYGVPHHDYELVFADGGTLMVDIADEDDWGNIQECGPDDLYCEDDWEEAVGYGNDCDGHRKIAVVRDLENEGTEWHGTKPVLTWFKEYVAPYAKNYSC